MTSLVDRLLPDELWQRIQPLLPPPPPPAPRRPGARQRGLLQPTGGQRGDLTSANPVDRGKAGSKLHVAGDAGGLPLAVLVSAANANDSTMLEAVLDDIPAIRMPTGRRRRRPGKVHGDKAFDHRRCRAYLRRRGIRPRIARRRIEFLDQAWPTAGRSSGPGPGWAGGGGCGSATSDPPNASTPWRCWPVRSSASTPSTATMVNVPECPASS
jgi:transposase